jgi:hypothetical protein
VYRHFFFFVNVPVLFRIVLYFLGLFRLLVLNGNVAAILSAVIRPCIQLWMGVVFAACGYVITRNGPQDTFPDVKHTFTEQRSRTSLVVAEIYGELRNRIVWLHAHDECIFVNMKKRFEPVVEGEVE